MAIHRFLPTRNAFEKIHCFGAQAAARFYKEGHVLASYVATGRSENVGSSFGRKQEAAIRDNCVHILLEDKRNASRDRGSAVSQFS